MAGTPLELIAVEVRGEIDQLQRDMPAAARVVDQSMDQIDSRVKSTERAIAVSSANMGREMAKTGGVSRVLGQQLSQVGQQALATGNVLQAVAIQLPDIAIGMSAAGASAGRFAAFLGGPWGTALVLATSVAIALGGAMLDDAEASDEHTKASKTLAEAISDQEKASKSAIQTSQQAEQQNYSEARSLLDKATAARKATIALLEAARSRLQTADDMRSLADPTGGESLINPSAFSGAIAARQVDSLTAKIKEQTDEIEQQERTVRRSGIPLLRRQAEEATDKAAAAEGRYNRAIAEQDELRTNGIISEKQYTAEVGRLGTVRDKEVEAANKSAKATKGDGDAKREAAKAARELEKAQRDLERALDSLVSRFDPARVAADKFRKTLADINTLTSKGMLSQGDAIGYRIKAAAEQAAAIAQAASSELKASLGYSFDSDNDPSMKAFREWAKDRDQRENAEYEAEQRINEKRRTLQENQIRSAATLYEDLFRGGTDAIWSDFQDIGLRVIARVLAQFTIARFSGGGFDLGSAISGAFTSVLGFASGGSMTIGGRGGSDRNTLSLNGRPIANVSRGETLNVGRGGVGGQTVVQNITVDARNSVNPDGFARQILAISGQQAQQAATAMGRGVMKAVPTRLAQYQRDGT